MEDEERNKAEIKKAGECFNELIEVNNAGIILLHPFFARLFDLSGYLNNRNFINDEMKLRAIFLLQYTVYGDEREYQEHELFFNKLIVRWPTDKTLPKALALTQKEKDVVVEVLNAVRQYWSKMKNTSIEGIREAFLKRKGRLENQLNKGQWTLTVDRKAYDVLLDSVPWAFKISKYPWNSYLIIVNW